MKRAPLWRVLASVLTAALVASGAALGVAAPAQAADGPTISVTEAPRAGGNVTVTGSGFSADQPGLYLGVRQNGVSTDAYTVWLSTTNVVGELPGLGATAPMNTDGSFSVVVPVAAFADGVSYSIVTRKAHGVQDPTQVTSTAIAYQPVPATSTTTGLTVSPSGTAVAGAQVTLTATVAPSGATGTVAFADGSTSLGSAPVSNGSASVQVSTLAVGSHQLTATFVPTDAAVFTGSASAATSYSITAAPSYTLAGAVTATANEKISVAVTGSGYANIPLLPGQQARSLYVALIPQGTPLSEIGQTGSLPNIAVSPNTQGDIVGTLEQAASALDRTKSYEIIAWPSRSNPSDSNLYARAAIEIDWNAVFPPAGPSYTLAGAVTVTANEKISVAVTGSGYADIPLLPGQQARSLYVALIPQGTPLSEVSQSGSMPSISVSPNTQGDIVGTLEQAASALDRTKSYELVAWPSRSFPSDSNLYQRAAVEIDWNALFPPATPVLTLSKSTDLDRDGETITVTGSGYDPTKPMYLTTCTDIALEDVTFAFISAGCTTGAKLISPNPTRPSMVQLNADGTFETTLAVAPKGATTAVYTIADHTAQADRSQDAKASVSFDIPAPSLTVTPQTDVDPSGDTLTITGTNYVKPASESGFTVRFGWVKDTWKPSAGAVNADRPAAVFTRVSAVANDSSIAWTDNGDGTVDFEWTADVSEAAAATKKPSDGNPQLGVFTFGNTASQGTQPDNELFVPVTWAAVEPEPELADPKVTVTPSEDLDPAVANVLTVSGTGFRGLSALNGVYVLFGETSVWQGQAPLPSSGWVTQGWVMPGQIVDGAFTTQVTIPANTLDASKSYNVATSAAHMLSVTDRSLDTFTPVTVAQPAAPYVGFPVSTTVQQGKALSFTGSGFAEGDVVTAVAHSEPVVIGTEVADATGSVAFTWDVPASFEVGEHTLELSVDGNVVASGTFTVAAAPTQPGGDISGATLTWGVKQSFRSYITGPIAKGSISLDRVAQNSDGLFIWSNGAGDYDVADAAGSVDYPGSVHFTGHDGQLDMLLANPRVEVKDAESGVLYLDVTSRALDGTVTSETAVPFASLALSTPVTTEDAATWVNSAATLTEQGAASFAGFYAAGTALDAVTFTFPVGGEATPVVGVSSSSVAQGGTLTITGSGFDENELVSAEIHSDVVTLPAQAAVGGVVSFAWTVPADFATGVHTVYLLRAGDTLESALSTTFTVTARAETPGGGTDPVVSQPVDEQPAAASCVAQSVSGASIQWGVKESFRSYITGPIAKGAISGGWGSGSGAYSTETDRGRVNYGGSIHYTGHSGLLDLTLSNPRIQINSATSASLILNVQSKGFNGSPDINASGVVFATLSLPAASESATRVSWSNASATLTAAGAEAFAGFYTAGTALDSVSFAFPLGEQVACDSTTDGALAVTGGEAPVGALWLGLGVLAIGAGLVLAVRRRRAEA